MKSNAFFIIIVMFFLQKSNSQTFIDGPLHVLYETCDTCSIDTINQASYVTSDFGPRYLPPPRFSYDWHQGLDLSPGAGNSDVGYRLRAIASGSVSKVGRNPGNNTNRLYYIAIDGDDYDFGYVHIFPRNSPNLPVYSGGFMFVETQHPVNSMDHYGIITPDSVLLSDCSPCDSHYYILGQDTLWATNQIDQGNYIAPLGNSGTVPGHLHLNLYEEIEENWGYSTYVNGNDEAIDPFEYIDHWSPDYKVKILHDSINTIDNFPEGIKLSYPGNLTSKILVRPIMTGEGNGSTYTSSSLNISKVELKMARDTTGSFDLIEGPFYLSEIKLGARHDDNVAYPNSVNVSGHSTGNWTRTGVMHFAYRDVDDAHPTPYNTQGGRPWDDFYFYDFASRVHKNDSLGLGENTNEYADNPDDARYNDGCYFVKSIITTVRDSIIEGPRDSLDNLEPIKIIIDNFMPYIKGTIVTTNIFQNDDLIYEKGWGALDPNTRIVNDGFIYPDSTSRRNNLAFNTTLWMYVVASEPLESLQAFIPALSMDTLGGQSLGSGLVWLFDLGNTNNIMLDTIYKIEFYGVDKSGNSLLNLSEMTDGNIDAAQIVIPKRQNNSNDSTSWLPFPNYTGVDSVHYFSINSCSSDSLLSSGPSLLKNKVNSCLKTSDIEIEQTNASSGQDNGSITISVTGGIAPYSFYWENENGESYIDPNNDGVLDGLGSGIYCYRIVDAQCCEVSGCREITECSQIIDSIFTNLNSNYIFATIALNPTSTSPWTFEWSNGDTTQTISNIPPGEYCVTVTDGGGCTTEECVLLCGNNFEIIHDNSTCVCPGGEGSIDITVTGDGPYTYHWTGPGNYASYDEDLNDIQEAGEYMLQVLDTFGCTETFIQIIYDCIFDINDFETMVSNNCDGNGGSIEISIPSSIGGNSPYSFSWYLPNSSGTLNPNMIVTDETIGHSVVSGLDTGIYCVAIATSNGCTTDTCFTIETFEAPEITYEITPTSTSSSSDGSISLEVQGGSTPYSYYWDYNGATTSTLSGLPTGIYPVAVGYGDGCTETLNIELLSCAELANSISLEASLTPLSSQGGGAIDLTVIGGDNYNFQYSWTKTGEGSFGNTEDINDLKAGEYCVTVSYPPCNITEELCITICEFELALIVNEFYCPAAQVMALASGADSFTYLWDNGEMSNTLIVPYGMERCVTVTGISGGNECSMEVCITPEKPELEINYDVINSTYGQSNGTIVVDPSGGIPPYTYQWDNNVTTPINSNIPAGDYCVTVTDDCGSTEEACITVECEISSDLVSAIITPVSCSGGTFGMIDLTVLGNPFNTYLWSNGATTQDLTGLSEGTYCVTIENTPTNCIYEKCYYVSSGGISDMEVDFQIKKIPCTGGTGGFSAIVSGGVAPYSYEWTDNSGTIIGTNQFINGLPAGESYQLQVTDALGCVYSDFAYLSSVAGFGLIVNVTNPICYGEVGSATITPIGGTAPYVFEWRKFPFPNIIYTETASSSTYSNLEPGYYFVRIIDSQGCVENRSIYIPPLSPLAIEGKVDHICENGGLGQISEIVIMNGTPPFNYQWNTGSTSNQLTNLDAATYTITVSDVNECTGVESFEVIENTPPSIVSTNTVHPTCNSSNDGSTEIIYVSGASPFTYQWETDGGWNSGPNASNILNYLSVGTYTVTVTDRYGCTTTQDFTTIAQNNFSIIPESIGPTYNTNTNIDISIIWHLPNENVTETNPIQGFSFSWQGPNGFTSNDQNISNYAAGIYTVTATHIGSGCTATEVFEISDCEIPDETGPQASIPFQNVTPCEENNLGSITVSAFSNSGGPISFYWEGPNGYFNSTTSSTISELSETGLYNVTVTDGCGQVELQQHLFCTGSTSLNVKFKVEHCDGGSITPNHSFHDNVSWVDSYNIIVDYYNSSGDQLGHSFYKVNNIWDLEHLSGDENISGLSPGYYTIISTSEYGFIDTDVIEILGSGECEFDLHLANLNPWGLSFYAQIGKCSVTYPCGGNSGISGAYLEYYPNDSDSPCTSGGTLKCGAGCCAIGNLGCFDISIPSSSPGIEVTLGDQCGCFFPAGSSDDELLDDWATLYDIGSPNPSLFGIFDCGVTEPPNDTIVVIDPNIEDPPCNACPFGCEFYHDFDNCRIISFCGEGSGEPVDTTIYENEVCLSYDVQPDPAVNAECELRIKCSLYSDCFNEDIETFPITWGGNTQSENEVIQTLALAGITNVIIDCTSDGNETCSCTELLNSEGIEKCPDCLNGDEVVNIFELNSGDEIAEKGKKNKPYEVGIPDFYATIYPNPFVESFKVEIQSKEENAIVIQVVNVLGKIVWREESSIDRGKHEFNIPLGSNIPVGIYHVLITDVKGNQVIEKVIHTIE